MKITRKQFDSFNEKCFNHYRMDLEYALTWGEKEPKLAIKVGEGLYIQAKIQFNWHNKIEVVASIWSASTTPGVYVSTGMPTKLHVYDEVHTRKMSAKLCKLTAYWPAEKVLEEYNKIHQTDYHELADQD